VTKPEERPVLNVGALPVYTDEEFCAKAGCAFVFTATSSKMSCTNCSLRPRLAFVSSVMAMLQAAMQRYAIVHAAMTQKAGPSSSGSRKGSSATASYGSLPPQQSLQQQVHWRSDGSMSALAYAGPEYGLIKIQQHKRAKD